MSRIAERIEEAFIAGVKRGLEYSNGYPMGTVRYLEAEAKRYAQNNTRSRVLAEKSA